MLNLLCCVRFLKAWITYDIKFELSGINNLGSSVFLALIELHSQNFTGRRPIIIHWPAGFAAGKNSIPRCDKHRLTSKRMRREICWWRRRRWRTTCSRRATPCLIKTLNTQNRIIINESTPLISWRTRMVPPRGRSWGPRSRTPLGRPPRRAQASWAVGASSPGRCRWTCQETARMRPVRKISF